MIKTMEIINNPGPAMVVWVILNCVEMDNLGNNSNWDHKLITGVFKLMPHTVGRPGSKQLNASGSTNASPSCRPWIQQRVRRICKSLGGRDVLEVISVQEEGLPRDF